MAAKQEKTLTFHSLMGQGKSTVLQITVRAEEKEKGICVSVTGDMQGRVSGAFVGEMGEYLKGVYFSAHDIDLLHKLQEFAAEYHLNDMKAGCEHQRGQFREEFNPAKIVPISTFKLTLDSLGKAERARNEAKKAAIEGRVAELDDESKYLIPAGVYSVKAAGDAKADPTVKPARFPDAYTLDKVETLNASSVYHESHVGTTGSHRSPDGILLKPCPVCGYKYGSSWLYKPLTDEAKEFLFDVLEGRVAPEITK